MQMTEMSIEPIFCEPIPFRIYPKHCIKCNILMSMYNMSDYCFTHSRRYTFKDLLVKDRRLEQSRIECKKRTRKLCNDHYLSKNPTYHKEYYLRKKEKRTHEKDTCNLSNTRAT